MHRTTLVLPDYLFRDMKRAAIQEKVTLKEMAALLLKRGLEVMGASLPRKTRSLPVHRAKALLDLEDKERLYDVLDDGRW